MRLGYSNEVLNLGLDVGSTTAKLVFLDEEGQLVYEDYERHHADIGSTLNALLNKAFRHIGDEPLTAMVTGSAGMSVSERLGLDFIQEVIACSEAIEAFIPETDVAIELGGECEDHLFTGGIDQRMNGNVQAVPVHS